MLKYFTTKSFFNGKQRKERAARVISNKKVNVDDLLNRMSAKDSSMKKRDMKFVLDYFFEEILESIKNGEMVSTPIFHSKYSLKGLFYTSDDIYDPSKHLLTLKFTPTTIVREALKCTSLFKITPTSNPIKIEDITDKISNKINSEITPLGAAIITGNNIRVVGNDPSVGVYFKNKETHQLIKVPDSSIIINRPQQLCILIPPLSIGIYELNIITQSKRGTTIRKNTVSHTLEFSLNVVR